MLGCVGEPWTCAQLCLTFITDLEKCLLLHTQQGRKRNLKAKKKKTNQKPSVAQCCKWLLDLFYPISYFLNLKSNLQATELSCL